MPDNEQNRGAVAFTRPFQSKRVAAIPFDMKLEGNEDELRALALLWRVLSVECLSAELKISAWRREGVRVRGYVRAHITQACVVTLEPLSSVVEEPVDVTFLPEDSRQFRRLLNADGELMVDPDGPDEPEPFAGGEIDIAQAVAEAVALGIDPYPRIPEAKLPNGLAVGDDSPGNERLAQSPFAALKGWGGASEK